MLAGFYTIFYWYSQFRVLLFELYDISNYFNWLEFICFFHLVVLVIWYTACFKFLYEHCSWFSLCRDCGGFLIFRWPVHKVVRSSLGYFSTVSMFFVSTWVLQHNWSIQFMKQPWITSLTLHICVHTG